MQKHSKAISAVIERVAELITAYVIPIYQDDEDGRPYLHGSGFFVMLKNACYLVSASHVLSTGCRNHLYYYITPNITRRIEGRVWSYPEENPNPNNAIDVAAVQVQPPWPPYKSVKKIAVPEAWLKSYLIRMLIMLIPYSMMNTLIMASIITGTLLCA